MRHPAAIAGFVARSVRRKTGRNLATVFCFAFIAANIFSAQYLLTGTAGGLDLGRERLGADLLVVPARYALITNPDPMAPASAGLIIRVEPYPARINREIMDRIGQVPDVAAFSPQLYVGPAMLPDPAASVDVYGIDPVTDFTVGPWLERPLKTPLGPGQAIVGSGVAGDTASTITLFGSSYAIAGRLAPTRSAVDRSVFVTLDDAYALAAVPGALPASVPPPRKGEVSAVLVRAAPGSDPGLVSSRIQQPFSSSFLRVLPRHVSLASASGAAQNLPAILNLVSLVVVTAAVPLIALIAAMVANERQREIGLLIAMGAKRSFVFATMLGESLVLAVAGGAAGTGASLLALFLLDAGGMIAGSAGEGFRPPDPAATGMMIALALAAVAVIGTLAAIWPAYRSSRMNPYDAIRTGE